MKIIREISISNFEAWCGAEDMINVIIEHDKVEDFDYAIEELYPDGITEVELNDILRFDTEFVYSIIGIEEEEEEEEEN